MTRSIFDPTNPGVERSGDAFTGPDASEISQMPASATDGRIAGEDAANGPADVEVEFDANGNSINVASGASVAPGGAAAARP